MSHSVIRDIMVVVFAGIILYEILGVNPTLPAAATVQPTTDTPNALAVPTPIINASTLSPVQLGTGLFGDASGLDSSAQVQNA